MGATLLQKSRQGTIPDQNRSSSQRLAKLIIHVRPSQAASHNSSPVVILQDAQHVRVGRLASLTIDSPLLLPLAGPRGHLAHLTRRRQSSLLELVPDLNFASWQFRLTPHVHKICIHLLRPSRDLIEDVVGRRVRVDAARGVVLLPPRQEHEPFCFQSVERGGAVGPSVLEVFDRYALR